MLHIRSHSTVLLYIRAVRNPTLPAEENRKKKKKEEEESSRWCSRHCVIDSRFFDSQECFKVVRVKLSLQLMCKDYI